MQEEKALYFTKLLERGGMVCMPESFSYFYFGVDWGSIGHSIHSALPVLQPSEPWQAVVDEVRDTAWGGGGGPLGPRT